MEVRGTPVRHRLMVVLTQLLVEIHRRGRYVAQPHQPTETRREEEYALSECLVVVLINIKAAMSMSSSSASHQPSMTLELWLLWLRGCLVLVDSLDGQDLGSVRALLT